MTLSADTDLLAILSSDALATLDVVRFPALAVDLDRRVRWQNLASTTLMGDVRGKLDRSIVAPEDLANVREAFARKLLGASHTEYEASLLDANGRRVRLALSSVPLRTAAGAMAGSFVIGRVLTQLPRPDERVATLTSRQRQVLVLLASGYSTSEMATLMSVTRETVRNHVKRLLRRLDAHSRVEAVARARRAGLI